MRGCRLHGATAQPDAAADAAAADPTPRCGSGSSSRPSLTLPVVLMAMIRRSSSTTGNGSRSSSRRRSSLWGGWPFHRAAWQNLRHGAATMDTLISVGTLAAWGWSVAALFFLGAGEPGMRMPFELLLSRAPGDRASTSRSRPRYP